METQQAYHQYPLPRDGVCPVCKAVCETLYEDGQYLIEHHYHGEAVCAGWDMPAEHLLAYVDSRSFERDLYDLSWLALAKDQPEEQLPVSSKVVCHKCANPMEPTEAGGFRCEACLVTTFLPSRISH